MTNGRADSRVCPHQTACGACALLDSTREAQLARKRRVLAEQLGHYPRLEDARLLSCLASDQAFDYRCRAKLAVGLAAGKPPRLGYFRPRSREIIDAPNCRVLVPELLETSRRVRSFLGRGRIPRELRHVDLRCGSDPTRQHLTLVFRAEGLPRFPLEALHERLPMVSGMSYNASPDPGPRVIKGAVKHLGGERGIRVDCAELSLRVSPASFFQVNLTVLPLIHDRMQAFLGKGELLADLYAGVGTHGLALRDDFTRVACIEGAKSSTRDARTTIEEEGVENVRVIASPVEKALDRLLELGPDAVVMNPSRAGARSDVLDALAEIGSVRRLVYLSCEPETLARDLDRLVDLGFALETVEPVDMMPQTDQVEALACLSWP
ncbi:MAG: hypothetical protein AAF533_05985 [Acidobacteriota bacterium]